MGEDGTNIGKQKLDALRDNSNYFRMRLTDMGLHVLGNYDSPIMPVMLYNPTKIAAFSREGLKRGLAVVLGDLAEMGYDARWGVIGGREAGLPHARERLWIYGSNADDIGSEMLLQKSSLSRKKNGQEHQLRLMGGGEIWNEWQNKSDRFGDCDGVANRVDRLTAVGNGQIPQVAALAWQILRPITDEIQ